VNKAFILKEIQRTAEANGGVPLGQQRFEAETGIRNRDWFGKFWARWGEAVREAGFEPKELNRAFEEAHLLEKLAGLVKELDHFPVAAELRLKRRRDPSFPSWNVFSRFGRQRDIAARLVDYCRTHPEAQLQEVAAICAPIAARSSASSTVSPPPQGEFGSVYLLKSGKFYKIGRSAAPGRRESELDRLLPQRGRIIHEIKTDDPVGIEAYWHQRFAAKCVRNEWFDLSADDVSAFKRRKSFM